MTGTHSQHDAANEEPGVKRYHAEKTRSPRRPPPVNLAILIGIIAIVVFVIYQFFFTRPTLLAGEEFNLSQAVEHIEELSTVRSHLRFAVVVREESGNIVVRELAEQEDAIAMEDVGSMLFHNPTLVAELHAVATYGLRLDNVQDYVSEANDTMQIALPKAELLDVKLVNSDTRIIARIKGMFRSPNNELLLEASRRGEAFAEKFARTDTTSLEVAQNKAQDIIRFLIEQTGKPVRFVD